MPTDLDARIRRAVIELVDTAPTPPAFDELSVPVPRNRPVRRAVTIAVAAVTVVAVALAAALFVRDEHPASIEPVRPGVVAIRLRGVPEGVSARLIDDVPVFLVRDGDLVSTFLTDVQHIAGDRKLWWCPSERLFRAPRNGETFDADGHVVGGPAAYGLDRFPTRVLGGVVRVDVMRVVSDMTPRLTSPPPLFPPGRISFCNRPLKSLRSPQPFVRIQALPTLKFDADAFEVPAGRIDLRFIDRGGSHVLRFRRASLKAVELAVPSGPNRVNIALDPGRYLVYCAIPGHRPAGQEATIVVTPK